MRNRGFTAIGLGTAVLLAACLVAAGTPESHAVPKPLRLAVVDLKVCFKKDRCDRMKHVHAAIGKLREEYSNELQELDMKVSKLKERVDAEPPGTGLYRDLFIQYRLAQNELRFKEEVNKYILREKSNDMARAAYNKIRWIVNLIGQEHKYDLILPVGGVVIEGEEFTSANQQIGSRPVLYQDTAFDLTNPVDITGVVIKRLNEEWAKIK